MATIHATIWMNLETVMPNEMSVPKDKHMVPLIRGYHLSRIHRDGVE